MTPWVFILIGVAALGLGALLAALYASLRNFSRSALEEIAVIREGSVGQRIARIVDDPEAHAGAILLPRVLCQLTVVVSSVLWMQAVTGAQSPEWLGIAGGLLIAGVLVWVFGTIIPISVAEHAAEKTIYRWAGFVRLMHVAMSPAAAATALIDEIVRRVVGGLPVNAADAVESEILEAVEEGEREGQIDEAEREMIEAVVEFRSRTVEQIMTPRTEVEALEYSDDLVAVETRVREIGHSRIPVFSGSLDTIDGMLYAKDLLHYLIAEQVRVAGEPQRPEPARADAPRHADAIRPDARARPDTPRRGQGFNLRKLLRPAVFVPETKTVRELLAEMLARRVHVALVADEYGGTSGLVTFEDIVEEVFGEIQDEYEPADEHDAPSVEIDLEAGAAQVDARLRIDEANDHLDSIGVHLPESEDYDTVGGLVVVTLGRIPTPGESIKVDGAGLVVLAAEPTRVTRVRVERITSREAQEAPQAWDGGGK